MNVSVPFLHHHYQLYMIMTSLYYCLYIITTGWVVRVYSDLRPDGSSENLKLMKLFEPYPFVDLCNVTRVLDIRNVTRRLFPMTWRFLPLMDPTVDRMLSRDMDSVITTREVAAVNQWLNENNGTFHLMHDHPFHCSSYFLGGKLLLLFQFIQPSPSDNLYYSICLYYLTESQACGA